MVNNLHNQLTDLRQRQDHLAEKLYQEAAAGPSFIRSLFLRETPDKFLARIQTECTNELTLEAKQIKQIEKHSDSLSYKDKQLLAQVKQTELFLHDPTTFAAIERRQKALLFAQNNNNEALIGLTKVASKNIIASKLDEETDQIIAVAQNRFASSAVRGETKHVTAMEEHTAVLSHCRFQPSGFLTRIFHADVRRATDEVEKIASKIDAATPDELKLLDQKLNEQQEVILSRSFSRTQAEALGFVSRWKVKIAELQNLAPKEKLKQKILGDLQPLLPLEAMTNKGFDKLVSKLWKCVPKEVQIMETRLYGNESLAKLKAVRRLLVYKRAGIAEEVSPSLAKRMEDTGGDLSLIKAIEKTVKKHAYGIASGRVIELPEHKISVLLFKNDQGKIELLVQGKQAGSGSFKTVRFADFYFTMKKEEGASRFVTKQARVAESQPAVEQKTLESTTTVEQQGSVQIVEGAVDQVLGIDIGGSQVSVTKEGSVIEEEEQELEKELRVTRELEGIAGIMPVHKVIYLETGEQIFVQEAAGFVFPELTTKVIDLEALRELAKTHLELKPFLMQCYERVMDTMCQMHERGWLHRDLKDENILLQRDGTVAVSDLGTACRVDERTKSAGGTPEFMAPECGLHGNQKIWNAIDEKADVWSMAIMVGGKRDHPFWKMVAEDFKEGGERAFRIIGHYATDPGKKAAYEQRYPEPKDKDSLEHLIWEATRISPQERPTMQEFHDRYIKSVHFSAIPADDS